jgi:hypothetical protein
MVIGLAGRWIAGLQKNFSFKILADFSKSLFLISRDFYNHENR